MAIKDKHVLVGVVSIHDMCQGTPQDSVKLVFVEPASIEGIGRHLRTSWVPESESEYLFLLGSWDLI